MLLLNKKVVTWMVMLLLHKRVVMWIVTLLQASGDKEVCDKAEQAQVAKENAAAEEA